MKRLDIWFALALLLLVALFVREAAQTKSALRALDQSARAIATAEVEDNHLWMRQVTVDEWTGQDGWQHSLASERRTNQTLRDWFDDHNRLVDEKIASKPLAYTPKTKP